MILTWVGQGKPHYVTQQGNIPYISDIGADILKPLFIVGCCITSVCFFASLFIERWLRHSGRLMPNMRTREKVFGSLAVFGAFLGGLGLILLSVFDTKRFTKLHRGFLLLFMLGVALSAIFSIIEYRWISKEYADVTHLRRSYIVKAVIAGILIILAIAFAILLFTHTEVGAVLEWVIAVGFVLYFLTFYYDLKQSKGMQRGELRPENNRFRGRGMRYWRR